VLSHDVWYTESKKYTFHFMTNLACLLCSIYDAVMRIKGSLILNGTLLDSLVNFYHFLFVFDNSD